MRLHGRTVVVTGAASGIGRAIALGAHADGATVVAADIDTEGLADLETDGILAVVTDVAVEDQVIDLIRTAVEATGRVDVLVNNAGNAGRGTVEALSPGSFETTMAIHTFSAVYAMRAAFPHMRNVGHGRVINMLSRGAEVPSPEGIAYSAAKAALLAVTRSAAREVHGTGILVNGMIPGPTNSAIWGVDRPELQSPDVTWPPARFLMTLPDDGPTGKVFWNCEEYRLFHPDHNGGRGTRD